MCQKCGCNKCETKGPLLTEGKVKSLLSEGLQYHIDKKVPLFETVYRIGSDKHLALIKEARKMYSRNVIDLCEEDKALIGTHLGEFALYEGVAVPLDLPMLNEIDEDDEYEIASRKLFDMTWDEVRRQNNQDMVQDVHDEVSKDDSDGIYFNENIEEQYPNFDLNKNIRYQDTSISSGMWRYTGQEQGGKGVYRNLNNGQILGFDRSDFDIFRNNLSSHFDISESINERADYKYLTQIILDAKPKYNVYYNTPRNAVNIGGVGYDKGDLVKNFNQKPGSSTKIKNNFYHAHQDPQKTKMEVEKLSKGKIKVKVGKNGFLSYSLQESINESKMPTQDQVDKFFALTQNEMHYLNSKPVAGQEGTFNLTKVEPWDEYDLSNWNSLVRKAKSKGQLNEGRKYNQEELLRLDLIARRRFDCDYEKCTDEQKAEVLKDKIKVGVKEALQEAKKDIYDKFLDNPSSPKGRAKSLILKFTKEYGDDASSMAVDRFAKQNNLKPEEKYILKYITKNDIKISSQSGGPDFSVVSEAEFKGKEVALGKPKRGGSKAYYVYVKDGDKVKKITFGSGGLRAKIKNKEARNAFAARHKCSTKKDRTKAGYWSCNLPRYAKTLGLGDNMNTFW